MVWDVWPISHYWLELQCLSSNPEMRGFPRHRQENDMSMLRQQMSDAMVLRGFSPRTRQNYLDCVSALAKHYHRSPDQLDAGQVQAYLLHLIEQRKLAYATVNQAACACRFLYVQVLKRESAAARHGTSITPAVTAIAHCARHGQRKHGWRRGEGSYCRCHTFIWYSRCRMRSMV